MEAKLKHLEMIQSIISRMANNSFALKGWAVALTTGILILSDKQAEKSFFLVAYIPMFFFWILDAYYLAQEKAYRDLYDNVAKLSDDTDFSLKAKEVKLLDCVCTFLSWSELLFYLPLCLVTVGIVIVTG